VGDPEKKGEEVGKKKEKGQFIGNMTAKRVPFEVTR